MSKRDLQLESIIEDAVAATGFDLWGVELIRAGKHSTLRVYIDSENGVNVDDCALVSRQVGAVLDVEDPITGEYNLEVSSPGMDRILFKESQYEAHIGAILNVKTRMPVDGRRKFKGSLSGLEGGAIVLQVDRDEYIIPIKNIDKAQVVPQF
ncbi:ribosome maturation factor RimP [Gayadomonas joobiniege]|uniref:ribosome maturation factor RimP n=1 Tax=Gayadomonas joobiniege TaxID=1234606 RepID=UPI0003728F3C|nr:ribosome maturation factor RimP [Gayadomonas joobiniege]